MSVNEDLIDALVAHRLRLLRYEAGVVDRLLRQATSDLGPILDEIETIARRGRERGTLTEADRKRLATLRGMATKAVRGLHDDLRAEIMRSLTGATSTEARAVAAELAHVLPVELAAEVKTVPLADLVSAVVEPVGGLRWTDRLAEDLLLVHDRIQAVLGVGIERGAPMPKIARMLRDVAGIESTYKGRLIAIARTEVQRVSNHAALRTYAANADVVGSVQWLATLDTRTCMRCMPLHNRTWTLDANGEPPTDAPIPPLHPRCRCFLAPVTRSWRELGIGHDPKLDGKAAIGPSFDAWLRGRPEAEQREVLGPSRWPAWAAHKLALRSFSDAGGTLTLDELAARYSSFSPPAI